jgi:hypothetical protein
LKNAILLERAEMLAVFRPLLEAVGMGSVARSEVSFTTFLLDMIDSALIWTVRVLAGRR